ncbi:MULTISPECIES: DUF6894 family protein [Methylorubrum]|uniref:DUF6894 family protein n=1 Tax=Methylorubrum TaxID=2282523 RepID=UPI001AE2CF9A|nr:MULTISPECIES: hypothetical protein [Methylorubrum]MCP1535530.1 hypothetical protein [Methylorubrum extorquens]MCY1640653.1 hypothetical protein [Methylorubrum sp. SL192]
MPRYHFHVHDGRSEVDTDGTLLDDPAAAKLAAITLAGEILKAEAKKAAIGQSWSLEVTDDAGSPLFRIEMRFSCPDVTTRYIGLSPDSLVA